MPFFSLPICPEFQPKLPDGLPDVWFRKRNIKFSNWVIEYLSPVHTPSYVLCAVIECSSMAMLVVQRRPYPQISNCGPETNMLKFNFVNRPVSEHLRNDHFSLSVIEQFQHGSYCFTRCFSCHKRCQSLVYPKIWPLSSSGFNLISYNFLLLRYHA